MARFALVSLLFVACIANAADKPYDSRGFLIVDGKPRLVIGLYENPKDDAKLQEIADSGFNLVQCPQDVAALDRAQKVGLKAWVNTGGALDVAANPEKNSETLKKMAADFKDHPALLIWEAPDEALWNVWHGGRLEYFWGTEMPLMGKTATESGKPELTQLVDRASNLFSRGLYAQFDAAREEFWAKAGVQPPQPGTKMGTCEAEQVKLAASIRTGIEVIRSVDPAHAIWLNHAPRNSVSAMRLFNEPADMAGCDIYAAPEKYPQGHSDLSIENLACVGAYTERMREAAPGKVCAMVLQGFGWADIVPSLEPYKEKPGLGSRPGQNETRFMAYNALLHGANALLYWGTASIEKDSTLWNDLMIVMRNIRAIEPAILAEPERKQPVLKQGEVHGSVDGDELILSLRKVNQDYFLFVMNETRTGIPFTVSELPKELDGLKMRRLDSQEVVSVENRSFSDGIRGRDVHIYTTATK